MYNRNWLVWVLIAAMAILAVGMGLSLMRINTLNQETTALRSRNVRLSQELSGRDSNGLDLESQLETANALNEEL